MGGDLYEKLTNKQRECLDLIGAGFSEKQIARQLDITPYAVKERLRAARRTLNIADSREAARGLQTWRENVAGDGRVGLRDEPADIAYTRDVGAHETLADRRDFGLSDAAAGFAAGRHQSDVARELRERHVQYTVDIAARDTRFWSLLFPRLGRRRNDLTASTRLALIAIQVAFIALSLAAGLAAIMAASGYLTWLSRHGG
jgi:DNA-binding CsgD family transcriptional regulator